MDEEARIKKISEFPVPVSLGSLLRSEGDGEEKSSEISVFENQLTKTVKKDVNDLQSFIPRDNLPPVSNIAKKLSKVSVFSVPDPLVLSSPPQDLEHKTKIQLRPTEGYLKERKFYSSTTISKRKEPKFIPYEPYKGCIKPIVGTVYKDANLKENVGIETQPLLSNLDFYGERKESSSDDEKINSIIIDFEKERSKWEQENTCLNSQNQDLQNQLAQCQKDLGQTQQQLSIQSQVNSELKKLLVASIGEDVQGRVQCLTEDKARMATMIRKYSEKVDKDYEEREKMTIQCDVWRSKFLASSLLIDELAKWKGSLFRHYHEAQEALKVLLQEREVIQHSLGNCYKHLRQTHDAFDPLHTESGSLEVLNASDVLSLSVGVSRVGESLRDRLLGTLGRAVGNTDLHLPDETKTPGEKMALQVLEHHLNPSCTHMTYPASPSRSALTLRFHPNARVDNVTVNCCGHCSGEIKVV